MAFHFSILFLKTLSFSLHYNFISSHLKNMAEKLNDGCYYIDRCWSFHHTIEQIDLMYIVRIFWCVCVSTLIDDYCNKTLLNFHSHILANMFQTFSVSFEMSYGKLADANFITANKFIKKLYIHWLCMTKCAWTNRNLYEAK